MSADEAVAVMHRLDRLIGELAVLRSHLQTVPARVAFAADARPEDRPCSSEPERPRDRSI